MNGACSSENLGHGYSILPEVKSATGSLLARRILKDDINYEGLNQFKL